MKIRPAGDALMHVEQTDGHDETNKNAFCNYAGGGGGGKKKIREKKNPGKIKK
jgi:hypothetical protein